MRPGGSRNASQTLPPRPVSVADRDYFKALREKDVGMFVGSLVMARVMKGLNFNVALRREGRSGGFDGVIVVTVFPEYFSNFWRDVMPRQDTDAALIRGDGMMLARAPRLDPNMLRLPANSSVAGRIRTAEKGSFYGRSAHDGGEQFFAFRKVGGYNAYMVYGLGTKAVSRAWRQHLVFYSRIFGTATLALLLLSLVSLQRSRRERQAKEELRLANVTMESRVKERTAELTVQMRS